MADIGENQFEGQKFNNFVTVSYNYSYLEGGGGAGCPGGETGANGGGGGGGYCQTRPRAEDSGNTWNEITVANATAYAGAWSSTTTARRTITYNGVTKTFASTDTGKLKELLDW